MFSTKGNSLVPFIVMVVLVLTGASVSLDTSSAEEQKGRKKTSETNAWQHLSKTSLIDDVKTVGMFVTAENEVTGLIGLRSKPNLVIRCQNKQTSIFVLTDQYLVEGYGYGRIRYRIDKNDPVSTLDWSVDDTHRAFGFWINGGSLPLIKDLFGAKKIIIEYRPFQGSLVEAVFPIAGIEKEIGPVREACGW